MENQPDPSRLSGCLTLTAMCLFTSLMFIANGILVGMIYARVSPAGPDWLRHPKVAQVLMFTGPVALLVCQWWLFDAVSDRVRRIVKR